MKTEVYSFRILNKACKSKIKAKAGAHSTLKALGGTFLISSEITPHFRGWQVLSSHWVTDSSVQLPPVSPHGLLHVCLLPF